MSIAKYLNQVIFNFFQTKLKSIFNTFFGIHNTSTGATED